MTNVVKQEDVDGVIDFATQTFGQLDILVNNAGSWIISPQSGT
ncbi:hypothetical protein [Limosilactobacillus fermentum]|nr:hypothetical protein [Limosilactobacillus fermentum]WFA01671.1 hypothetical protein P3T70_08995 [Limosilactobacillus fermentum]